MNKKLGTIASLAAILMSGGYQTPNHEKKQNINLDKVDGKPKQPPLPNGAKWYYFDVLGDIITREDEAIYKTIAISEKSAIKKFNAWLKKQPNEKS